MDRPVLLVFDHLYMYKPGFPFYFWGRVDRPPLFTRTLRLDPHAETPSLQAIRCLGMPDNKAEMYEYTRYKCAPEAPLEYFLPPIVLDSRIKNSKGDKVPPTSQRRIQEIRTNPPCTWERLRFHDNSAKPSAWEAPRDKKEPIRSPHLLPLPDLEVWVGSTYTPGRHYQRWERRHASVAS